MTFGAWVEKRKEEGVTKDYVIKEVLLGTTIGFAQVPESVAFAYLANVSPPIALHAAWMVGLICSLFGGRPGMVNGATGAFAAIIGTFLPEPKKTGGNGEGIEMLFPSVMVAGVLMGLVSVTGLSRFILLLPKPVMLGFCNGLAIVIGWAQLHPFQDPDTHEYKHGAELWCMLAIMFASMLTMELCGKIPFKVFKIIPSSLMAIILAIVIEFAIVRPAGARTETIGDVNEFTPDTAFPLPFFLKTKFQEEYDYGKLSADDTWNILRQGVLLCIVGSIESLMTAEVVESFTKTPGDGDRTVLAMGVGNLISGFMGGMGGNAMIGLSTINVLNGGVGRLAPTCTALLVMVSVMGAYPLLNLIPVAALAGIMLVVVIHTFKWFTLMMCILKCVPDKLKGSIGERLPCMPKDDISISELAVIVLVTVLAVISNIAYAVGVGVAVCSIIHAWNSGASSKVNTRNVGETKVYEITGPFFFTTANKILKVFDVENDPQDVRVEFVNSNAMDYTADDAIRGITESYEKKGKTLTVIYGNRSDDAKVSTEITHIERVLP